MAELTKEQVIQRVTQDIASKTEKNSISPNVLATIIIDAIQLINKATEFDFTVDENGVVQGLNQKLNFKEGILEIAANAFDNNTRTYGKVTLPSTLTAIRSSAFRLNFISGTLVIPPLVTLIESSAFQDNLIEELNIQGTGNIVLEDNAFADNLLSGVITVNPNLIITGSPFARNTNITQVVFEEGVTTLIGFSQCSGVTSVVVPSTANEIGEKAFNSTSITSIDLSNILVIGNYAFSSVSTLTSITFNSNLTSIGFGAFASCTNITSVVIPSTVTTIEGSAFRNTGIASISIPSSVTTLGNEIFRDSSLSSVTIDPSNYATMGESVFFGCNFTSIDLSGATTIKFGTFRNNVNLTTVTFSSTLVSISSFAFRGCNITSVDVPVGCDVSVGAFESSVTINYVL